MIEGYVDFSPGFGKILTNFESGEAKDHTWNAFAGFAANQAPNHPGYVNQAYAQAMERVWYAFPNDSNVGALFAESLKNLDPWDLWTGEGKPKGRDLEVAAVLERTLAWDSNHPGANHFYIHAIEASTLA